RRRTVALNGITNLEVHEVALTQSTASAFLRSLKLAGEYVLRLAAAGREGEVVLGCRDFLEEYPARAVVFASAGRRAGGAEFYSHPAYTPPAGDGHPGFHNHPTPFPAPPHHVGGWGAPA